MWADAIQCKNCKKPCDFRSKTKLCRDCFEAKYYGQNTFIERFWKCVVRTDGCWQWTGRQRHKFGYGVLGGNSPKHFGRRSIEVHRLSWIIHFGPIPKGLCVLHKCDNPECTRPDHLFLGTTQDNLADMRSKGREARGDRHGSKTHPKSFPGRAQNFINHPPQHVLNARKRRARSTILGKE